MYAFDQYRRSTAIHTGPATVNLFDTSEKSVSRQGQHRGRRDLVSSKWEIPSSMAGADRAAESYTEPG